MDDRQRKYKSRKGKAFRFYQVSYTGLTGKNLVQVSIVCKSPNLRSEFKSLENSYDLAWLKRCFISI